MRRAMAAALISAALPLSSAALPLSSAANAAGTAPTPGALKISQQGPAGEPAIGGCWALTIEPTGDPVRELCDIDDGANDGMVSFADIAAGSYRIHQRIGPDRYRVAEDITFELAAGQSLTKVTRHQPYPVLRVRSTDGSATLSGSCWVLRPSDQTEGGDDSCDRTDGNVDGLSEFIVREPGQYQLFNTTAPSGFAPVAPLDVSFAEISQTITVTHRRSEVAPVNLTLPSIVGTAQLGQTLTGDVGTWQGTPTTYGTTWLRCSPAGDGCLEIINGVDRYRLAPVDLGRAIRFRVTATNTGGDTTAQSEPLAILESLPVAITPPVITGPGAAGAAIEATAGTWSVAAPMTYQWLRCSWMSPDQCEPIAGARTLEYRLTPDDAGNFVRIAVTATNTAGSVVSQSLKLYVNSSLKPFNLVAPTVSGTPNIGQTLTATRGQWVALNGFVRFRLEWMRCTDAVPTRCQGIDGASDYTYVVQKADANHWIRVRVDASNDYGTTPVVSNLTPEVMARVPVLVTPPEIVGPVRLNSELRATTGGWSSEAGSMRYRYQWERCGFSGTPCELLRGERDSTYKVVRADNNFRLRVTVTALNDEGGAVASSAVTELVIVRPPRNEILPSITGDPRLGRTLYAVTGYWTSEAGPIRYSYQWVRMLPNIERGEFIPGAENSTYRIKPADVGYRLRVIVYATNNDGQQGRGSDMTSVVMP